jgi:hypothetical protein
MDSIDKSDGDFIMGSIGELPGNTCCEIITCVTR